MAFSWRCPKGHNVDSSFSKAELSDWSSAGKQMSAICPHCGGREYLVEAEQQKRILKELSAERHKEPKEFPRKKHFE
jgi:hypothetical protein